MTSEPRAGDVRVGLEPDTGRPARRFHPAARVVLAALAMLVSALSPLLLLLIPGAQAYLNAATPEVAGAFIIDRLDAEAQEGTSSMTEKVMPSVCTHCGSAV